MIDGERVLKAVASAILFDLDGVFYQKNEAIAGAAETLAWVRSQGIPYLFLTNTTSCPRRALVEKLQGMGIAAQASDILAPPGAAANWLKANTRGPVALFVPAATWEEFQGLPLAGNTAESSVAAVMVGDLGEGWDFATLNRAFRLLMARPQPVLIALGMTLYWRAAEGLRLDTAPFVVALEHATGAQAVVLGKPAAPFFQTALDLLGTPAAETVIVGDDIRADVDSAQQLSLSGVLVKTGKFQPDDLKRGIEPAAVMDFIAAFAAWWEKRRGVSP
jgi:HAD superfamily hydrolase (TIGR01458 family)